MSEENNRLYQLLPSIYRQKDSEYGDTLKENGPLKELLNIIEKQVDIIENDITQLYENWFIETCQPWVIPYIADLLGIKLPYPSVEDLERNRAYVANTIRYRRRKGTLSVLESLAMDITGWPCRAVEYFKLIDVTQNLNHQRPELKHTLNLRDTETLRHLGTPFDTSAHSYDLRSIKRYRGLYHIPNIGLHLWRVRTYPIELAPAVKVDSVYYFSQFGKEIPLYHYPESEYDLEHLAEEKNIPHPITRYELYQLLKNCEDKDWEKLSFSIYINGARIPPSSIIPWNSDAGNFSPEEGKVAIDPEKGKFMLRMDADDVKVSYYYGFTADIGGGQYTRQLTNSKDQILKKIKFEPDVEQIIQVYIGKIEDKDLVIEIDDNQIYKLTSSISLKNDTRFELRAAQNKRPLIKSDIIIKPSNTNFININLDGLLINGPVTLGQDYINPTKLGQVMISHCSVKPDSGVGLKTKANSQSSIIINKSIISKIEAEGSEILIRDSVIENGNSDESSPSIICEKLSAENSTFLGEVHADSIGTVSNCLFRDPVNIHWTQTGCLRYSYVPPGSKTPRQFKCIPMKEINTTSTESDNQMIQPTFNSTKYGQPCYAQLNYDYTPKEITEGADNGAEMGAFNYLLQAHRLNHLRLALDEYLRFGLEAGVILWS